MPTDKYQATMTINGRKFIDVEWLLKDIVDYLTRYTNLHELNSWMDEAADEVREYLISDHIMSEELEEKFRKEYLRNRFSGICIPE